MVTPLPWLDKILSHFDAFAKMFEDKNWETDFYKINYVNIVENVNSELMKEYITIESELDEGDMFRSNEAEPESLKRFITSTIQSLKDMAIPQVVEKDTTDAKKSRRKLSESFVTDLTRYYTFEEVTNENIFAEKLNIIKGEFYTITMHFRKS